MTARIILLGKDGQLGRALHRALAPLGELVAFGRADADFEHPDELGALIEAAAPDVVVNAAAYTAVDKAEAEPARAHGVNAEAVAALAASARRRDALLIHYSTDYVFDGQKPSPYCEDDPPHPLNTYGVSKLAGDRAVLGSGCRHLIFRVSWVYSAGSGNFPAAILRLARERDRLEVVADQCGAPTRAGLIADITAAAIARNTGDPLPNGLYHLAPTGTVSRADLARFIVAQARAAGMVLALSADDIADCATSDRPAPAERPLNSRLDTTKLRTALGIELPPWQQDLRNWLAGSR